MRERDSCFGRSSWKVECVSRRSLNNSIDGYGQHDEPPVPYRAVYHTATSLPPTPIVVALYFAL